MPARNTKRLMLSGVASLLMTILFASPSAFGDGETLYWSNQRTPETRNMAQNNNWSTSADSITAPASGPSATANLIFNVDSLNASDQVPQMAGGNRTYNSMTFRSSGTTDIHGGASTSTSDRFILLGEHITVDAGAGPVIFGTPGADAQRVRVRPTSLTPSIINNSSSDLTFARNLQGFQEENETATLTVSGMGSGGIIFDGGMNERNAATNLAVTINRTGASAGNVIYRGNFIYTGDTTIQSGGLILEGSISDSDVTVHSGGRLSGDGTIDQALTVLSGGVVEPDGVLTAGTTTFASGSELRVAPGDELSIDGDLIINGGTLNVSGAPQSGQQYRLVSYTGALSGSASGFVLSGVPQDWILDYRSGEIWLRQSNFYYTDAGSNKRMITTDNWSTIPTGIIQPAQEPGELDNLFFNIDGVDSTIPHLAAGNRAYRSMTFRSSGVTQIDGQGFDSGSDRQLILGAGGITLESGAGAVNIGRDEQRVFMRAGDNNQSIVNDSSSDITFNFNYAPGGPIDEFTTTTITVSGSGSGGVIFSRIVDATDKPMALTINTSGTGTTLLADGPDHTYSGDTTVQSGHLRLEGTLSDSAVTVQSGGRLSGDGTIVQTLTVLNGGVVEPDGVLTAGTTTFASGSELRVAPGDELSIDGDLIINGGTLNVSGALQAGQEYMLVSYTGALSGSASGFTLSGTPEGWALDYRSGELWLIQTTFYYTDLDANPRLSEAISWSLNQDQVVNPGNVVPGADHNLVFNMNTLNTASVYAHMAGGDRHYNAFTFRSSGSTDILRTRITNPSGSAATSFLIIGPGGVTVEANAGAVSFGDGTSGQRVFMRAAASQSIINNSSSDLYFTHQFRPHDTVDPQTTTTLTVGGSGSGGVTFSRLIDGSDDQPLSLTINRTGTGVTTLDTTGAAFPHNYTGDTIIQSGRLRLEGTLSESAVTVQSGGRLMGDGEIQQALTVLGGGRVAPEGVLTAGTTTFAPGSELFLALGDELSITGDLVINGGGLILSGTPQSGQQYRLVSYTGDRSGSAPAFGVSGVPEGWMIEYRTASKEIWLRQSAFYYTDLDSNPRLSEAISWSLNPDEVANPGNAVPGATDSLVFNMNTLNTESVYAHMAGGDRHYNSFTFRSSGSTDILRTRITNPSGSGAESLLIIGSGGVTVEAGAGNVSFGDGTSGQRVFMRAAASHSIVNHSSSDLYFTHQFRPHDTVDPQTLTTLTVGGSGSGGVIFSRLIDGSADQPLALTINRSGTGVTTLDTTGANFPHNYTGDTIVQLGRLRLEGTVSESAVTVQSGGRLQGNGTIEQTLTVRSGGVVEPDGQLTAGTTTFESGSELIVAPGDELNIVGDLINDGGTIIVSGTPQSGQEYRLVSYSGALSGSASGFELSGAPAGWSLDTRSDGIWLRLSSFYYTHAEPANPRLHRLQSWSTNPDTLDQVTVSPDASSDLVFNINSLNTADTYAHMAGGDRHYNSFTFKSSGSTDILRTRDDNPTSSSSELVVGAGGITLNAGAGPVNFGGIDQLVFMRAASSLSIENNSGSDLTFHHQFAPHDSVSAETMTTITVTGSGSGGVIFERLRDVTDRPMALTINRTGTGVTTLGPTSANFPHTHSGDTIVQSGHLRIEGQLTNSAVTVQAGGTISGDGTIDQTLTFEPGSELFMVLGETLTLESDLVINGGGLTISGAPQTETEYLLIEHAGDRTGAVQIFSASSIPSGWAIDYRPVGNGGQVWLTQELEGDVPSTFYWSNAEPANQSFGRPANWSVHPSVQVIPSFAPGATDDVVFNMNTLNATAQTAHMNAGNREYNSLTFRSSGTTQINRGLSISTNDAGFIVGAGGITVENGAGAVIFGTLGTEAQRVQMRASTSLNIANHSSSLLTFNRGWASVEDAALTILTLNGTGSGGTRINGIISDGATGSTVGLAVNTTGGGVTSLGGVNTYTGPTTISSGTLRLIEDSALDNTAITVTGSGVFAVQPAVAGTVHAGSTGAGTAGATLNLGGRVFDMTDGAINSFHLQQQDDGPDPALTLANGATLMLDLNEHGADQLAVTQAADVSGTIHVAIETSSATSLTDGASYPVVTAASGLSGGTWQFAEGGTTRTIMVGLTTYQLNLIATDTEIRVEIADFCDPTVAPAMTSPGHRTVNVGGSLSFSLTAQAPSLQCDAPSITHSALPPGMTHGDSVGAGARTRTYSWSPQEGDQGAYPIQVTATDENLLTTTITFIIYVGNSGEPNEGTSIPPPSLADWSPISSVSVAGSIGDITWDSANGVVYELYYSDDPVGPSMNWTLLQANMTGTGAPMSEQVAASGARRFFQVVPRGLSPGTSGLWGVIRRAIPAGVSMQSPPLESDRNFSGQYGDQLAAALPNGTQIYVMGAGAQPTWTTLTLNAGVWSPSGVTLEPGQGMLVLNPGGAVFPAIAGRVGNGGSKEQDIRVGFNILGFSEGRDLPVATAFASAAPIGNFDETQADQIHLLNSNGSWRRLIRLGNNTWYDTQTQRTTTLALTPGQAFYYIRRSHDTKVTF